MTYENTFAGCAKLGFESNVAHGRRFYANTPDKRNAVRAFKWELISNLKAKHLGGREERNFRTCLFYWVDTFVFEDGSVLTIRMEEENGRTILSTARISEGS